jgi:hypothetical protein
MAVSLVEYLPRLLELLPVDEPVDNFMAWQMAQRLVA